MSELTAYAERVAATDETTWLGKLCWYSVSEVRVPHADVIQALVDAGIHTNLPFVPKDVDVFRRVCTAAERKKQPTSDPNIFVNFRMAEFTDSSQVVRRVTAQFVDNKGKKLHHRECADIQYNRGTQSIKIRPLGNGFYSSPENTVAKQMCDEVVVEYNAWRGCLNAYAIREWIRHFLLRQNATPVRPGGGVYFVKNELAGEIESLEDFAAALPAGVASIHSLPLIDDRKQREMVKDAFESETTGAAIKLLGEIKEIEDAAKEKGEQIPEKLYKGKLEELSALTTSTKDYQTVLQDELTTLNAQLDIVQRSVMSMTSNVKWD